MQISAVKFKATCLKLIDRVAETGEPVIITKRARCSLASCPTMASPVDWAGDAARSRSCARTRSCSSWERESRGMLVLDTHALIWVHMGVRIPKKVAKRIEAAGQANQLFISAITPWEIVLGVRRGL